jgi:integrase
LATLPKGVFRVKRWWYYQHRRGRPDHGPLIALPEYGTPEFWTKLADITGDETVTAFTVDALIREYRAHPKYVKLSAGSKLTYEPALGYVSKRWGPLRVDGLTPPAIQAFMDDEFAARPSMGNLTLSVLKTLLKFGVPRGYIGTNPAREIEDLEEDREGAKPWPETAWRKVVDTGPTELSRLAVLGRATGQRISDLVTMRPRDRDGAGINVPIKKLAKKLRGALHWCPLSVDAAAVIDGWAVFANATYLTDEKGRPFNSKALARRLAKYLAADPELAPLGLSAHGLRSLAVCDRRIEGQPHQRISAAIGMSMRQVMNYSRYIDQRLAAGDVEREQNEAVKTRAANVKTQDAN